MPQNDKKSGLKSVYFCLFLRIVYIVSLLMKSSKIFRHISAYFFYKEFFSRINAILMFSPIDTRIIDENVDTAYRNSINNSQLLMKMSILRIEICINNLCIDGIKHQYCVIIIHAIVGYYCTLKKQLYI